MHRRVKSKAVVVVVVLAFLALFAGEVARAEEEPVIQGEFRGVLKPVKFDVSPALREIEAIWPEAEPSPLEVVISDDPAGAEWPMGPQTPDEALQTEVGEGSMPPPLVSFDGPSSGGANPPDPNGDVGPNHVVMMSNLSSRLPRIYPNK